MELLFIILAIVLGIANKSKKKEQQEAAKKQAARQAMELAGEKGPRESENMPAGPAQKRPADPRFPDYYDAPVRPEPAPPVVSASRESSIFPALEERPVKPTSKKSPGMASFEGSASGEGTTKMPRKRAVQMVGDRLETPVGRRHALEASGITGHAHTESSMTGFSEPCPPAVQMPKRPLLYAEQTPVSAAGLTFDRQSVVKGFLYGEILGKPKALRR